MANSNKPFKIFNTTSSHKLLLINTTFIIPEYRNNAKLRTSMRIHPAILSSISKKYFFHFQTEKFSRRTEKTNFVSSGPIPIVKLKRSSFKNNLNIKFYYY